jgi:peptide/nickel transport system substrate-binding protein
MPLATADYPSLTTFTPVLARGWSLRGQQLTVELRSGVHWQDGSPVTSRDVYDTALLDGTNGSSFWNDITGVTAPSATEVVFTIRKGIAPVLAEDNLFADLYTVPASVYGSVVTPGLESAEQAYDAKDDANPTAAAATTQYKTISSVDTKLAALPVPTLLGDGPFELKNVTMSEALLEKWAPRKIVWISGSGSLPAMR